MPPFSVAETLETVQVFPLRGTEAPGGTSHEGYALRPSIDHTSEWAEVSGRAGMAAVSVTDTVVSCGLPV